MFPSLGLSTNGSFGLKLKGLLGPPMHHSAQESSQCHLVREILRDLWLHQTSALLGFLVAPPGESYDHFPGQGTQGYAGSRLVVHNHFGDGLVGPRPNSQLVAKPRKLLEKEEEASEYPIGEVIVFKWVRK